MRLAMRPLHVAIFVAIMAIWGLNFVIAKIGLQQLPPLLMMALRWVLVAVLLLPFVKPPRGRWRQVMLVSVTLGFLHFALMFTGLQHIDASTAAIAIQLQVPFAALLSAVIFKDWTYPCRFLRWFVITCKTLGNLAFTGLPRLLHLAAI